MVLLTEGGKLMLKVQEMLNSEPKASAEKAIEKWRELGPLSIQKDFKEVNFHESVYRDIADKSGMFLKGSETMHGIIRWTEARDFILESAYYQGEQHGIARYIWSDGGVRI